MPKTFRAGKKYRLQQRIRREAEKAQLKVHEELETGFAPGNESNPLNEEIESSEDEYTFDILPEGPRFEEIEKTVEEERLELAKKYILELEEQELVKNKKLSESELKQRVLSELKLDDLANEGVLMVNLAHKVKNNFTESDIKMIKCKHHKLAVTCVVATTNYIYSGAKEGTIIKWSLDNFKRIARVPASHKMSSNKVIYNNCVLSLAVSYTETYLASCSVANDIVIRKAEDLTFLNILRNHRSYVTGIVFSNKNNQLYSCSADKTIKRWEVDNKAYMDSFYGHSESITDIAFMFDNVVVSAGGHDKTLRIWKMNTESQLIYDGYNGNIDCVESLNKQAFVSCGMDGSICTWSSHKKFPICVLKEAHGINPSSQEPYWIISLVAYKNSDVFATGSCNGEVKIWKTSATYEVISLLATIPIKGFVNSIAFSANFTTLILGVGQELKCGRWEVTKEAKNSIVIIKILKDEAAHLVELENKRQSALKYYPLELNGGVTV